MYFAYLNEKKAEYYNGIKIKADLGLHEQIANKILKLIPKGARILDFGAGEGALSQRLNDLGYYVISADIDEINFKAQTDFIKVNFNNDNEVKSFIDKHCNSFDLVLGIEVIEHLENPWHYIKDLKMLVKAGGYILVTTPNITSWFSRLIFLKTGRFHQFQDSDRVYGHINPISADELELICEMNQLDKVTIEPAGTLPRIWIKKSILATLKNIFGYIASFGMKGIYDGWCIMGIFQKNIKE